jgi:hypothetical protein
MKKQTTAADAPKCRHKQTRRKHINSCVSKCLDCGMLHAMIVGRSSISRRWVSPDDPRVEVGEVATEAVLGIDGGDA